MLKIDGHQHFWNLSEVAYPWLVPEYGAIYDLFEPSLLAPQVKAAGVDKTILVQSANNYADTASMLVHSDYQDWIGGIIGWVNLLNPDETEERISAFEKHPKFRGIRHLIHTEADPDWVLQDRVIESLKVLAAHQMIFEVVAIFPIHLKHVPTLAKRVPNLQLVIDHLAKPPVGKDSTAQWQAEMKAAAEAPLVAAKVSGQFDNPAWTVADVRPYVDFAFEQFGADRLLFGSDWPVCILGGSYASVWANTQGLLEGRSQAEKDALLGGTASRIYRIS